MSALKQVVLVSGLSGSGKSVALKALEDGGYYAVDNLPASMVDALVAELPGADRIAIAIDVRAGDGLGTVPSSVRSLRSKGIDCRVVFLEASDESISHRFAETRRPHPLASVVTGGMLACIREERQRLTVIAELAHRMDTSNVNANTLRTWIKDWLGLDNSRLALTFQSFGFKKGLPIDADFVFDARFLPNPYYDTTLRPLTGKDSRVAEFLAADAHVGALLNDISDFLNRWLPQFSRDHRSGVTIAVGCTGGQHRSVYLVERLAERFANQHPTLIRHRDLA